MTSPYSEEVEELAAALRWGTYGAMYIHEVCGKVALFFEVAPLPGQVASSHGVWYPDGKRVMPGDEMRCFQCGEPMRLMTRNVRPL